MSVLFREICFEFQNGLNFHLDSSILKLTVFFFKASKVVIVFILQLSLPVVFSGNIATALFTSIFGFSRDFPDGPVANTLRSQGRGPGFDP